MGRRPASGEQAEPAPRHAALVALSCSSPQSADTLRHPSLQPPHVMLRLPSLVALAAIAAAVPVAHAQQRDATPETIVRSAERALQDDSLETVTARWRAALERDSTDPAATLGLATVARQTYDFERADSLLQGLLARSGTRVDGWTVRARLGIYRVANARGEVKRADSLLRAAMAEARQLDDRPAQIAALIGFTNTRSGDPTALYARRLAGVAVDVGAQGQRQDGEAQQRERGGLHGVVSLGSGLGLPVGRAEAGPILTGRAGVLRE